MKRFKLVATILVFCITVALITAILVAAFQRAAEARRRKICADNLRQIGTAFKMYAEDWNGRFPQSQIDDRDPNSIKVSLFFFNGPAMFPEYLNDPALLICPSDSYGVAKFKAGAWNLNGDPDQPFVPEAFDGFSYLYFPWVAANDDELETLVGYAKTEIKSALDVDPPNLAVIDQDMVLTGTEWEGKGNAGFNEIYRLRLGIERFFITDIEMPGPTLGPPKSTIPVMMDTMCDRGEIAWFNHIPPGCNVLFLDGRVDYIRWPGDFPVSRRSGVLLGLMDELNAARPSWMYDF